MKTHSELLSKKLGYKYFSLFDVMLDEIKNKTKIGLILEKYLISKTDIPDEYMIILMKDAIINLKEDGIVFNGYPQTIAQAKALDFFLFSRKMNKIAPIFLKIESITSLLRISKKYDKDSFKPIMANYANKMKMVESYYENVTKGFDTTMENIDVVNENIIKCISA
jgi:adenylate kinase